MKTHPHRTNKDLTKQKDGEHFLDETKFPIENAAVSATCPADSSEDYNSKYTSYIFVVNAP
ncbi:MAG: hypothetical protein VZQ49_03795 [Methanobrevibacter sp.]|nr:hypothetical protein [Methanobrevibacter sp.]